MRARIESGPLYYNLGNADFKLKEYGRAIASYQRGLRLAPREQDILTNLRYVRGVTKDKTDRPKSTEISLELLFATAKSRIPSPFRSTATIDRGNRPTARGTGA